MKIATYHKKRGDYVEFYKGKAPYSKIITFDKIYITSLFTFHFDITLDTVLHYRTFISDDRIFFGGISASIMPDRFKDKIGKVHLQTGQRRSSCDMGYDDDVNVDELPLDYDILDDISYKYPAADNFFAYATRGCKNKCKFCAVPILEPEFKDTNNLIEQVTYVREMYGDKRSILLMDNNVLCSSNLNRLVEDLNSLGFKKNEKNFTRPNFLEIGMKKIERRAASKNDTYYVTRSLLEEVRKMANRGLSVEDKSKYDHMMSDLNSTNASLEIYSILNENREWFTEVVGRHTTKVRSQRYVDFNQGIDARLLNDENMRILSDLPLNPFRLAYDSPQYSKVYEKAFRTAYKYGVRSFSNYMLYNYDETPEELWIRMDHNVRLRKELGDVNLFSFPMRYAPIDMIDRSYIGKYWTKKQLDAMNVILNVTKGVVMGEDDFFYRAYGNSPEGFLKVLAMPTEFIKYRNYFDGNGMNDRWSEEYDALSEYQKTELVEFLSKKNTEIPEYLEGILSYYSIKKASS